MEDVKIDDGIKHPALCPLRLFTFVCFMVKKESRRLEVWALNLSPATQVCLGV